VTPLREQTVRKQFKSAASEGARRMILVGPDEVAAGTVQVKDMGAGTETAVSLAALLEQGSAALGDGAQVDGAQVEGDQGEAAQVDGAQGGAVHGAQGGAAQGDQGGAA